MPLLDRTGLRTDIWQASADGASAAEHVIVGFACLDAVLAGNGRGCKIGVAITNDVKAVALEPYLDQVELIAIAFPNSGDGRGFSIARQSTCGPRKVISFPRTVALTEGKAASIAKIFASLIPTSDTIGMAGGTVIKRRSI